MTENKDFDDAVLEALEGADGGASGRPVRLEAATATKVSASVMNRSPLQLRTALLNRLKVASAAPPPSTRPRFLSEPLPARGELLLARKRRQSVTCSIEGPPVPVADVQRSVSSASLSALQDRPAGSPLPAEDSHRANAATVSAQNQQQSGDVAGATADTAAAATAASPAAPPSPPPHKRAGTAATSSGPGPGVNRPATMSRSSADLRRALLRKTSVPRTGFIPSKTLSVSSASQEGVGPPPLSHADGNNQTRAMPPPSPPSVAEEMKLPEVDEEESSDEEEVETSASEAGEAQPSIRKARSASLSQLPPSKPALPPPSPPLTAATTPKVTPPTLTTGTAAAAASLQRRSHTLRPGLSVDQLPPTMAFGNLLHLQVVPSTPVVKGDPRWVTSSNVSRCQRCDRKFTLLSRKHHCRGCGLCICSDCSPYRTSTYKRLCRQCNAMLRGSVYIPGDLDGPNFIDACSAGDVIEVTRRLDDGQDPDFAMPGSGLTALHASVESKQLAVAQLLLKRGCDPNVIDCHGRTALHTACVLCASDAVELLLKGGADWAATDEDGVTPLRVAVAVADQQKWDDASRLVLTIFRRFGALDDKEGLTNDPTRPAGARNVGGAWWMTPQGLEDWQLTHLGILDPAAQALQLNLLHIRTAEMRLLRSWQWRHDAQRLQMRSLFEELGMLKPNERHQTAAKELYFVLEAWSEGHLHGAEIDLADAVEEAWHAQLEQRALGATTSKHTSAEAKHAGPHATSQPHPKSQSKPTEHL